jgi:hypothetical protein
LTGAPIRRIFRTALIHLLGFDRRLTRLPALSEEDVMRCFHRLFSSGVASLLLTTVAAWAQLSTAQLSGRVSDESSAVLPGVTITAMQTDTGFTRSDVTDGNGSYVLSNLPPGPYRLEVSLAGFRAYVQTGIVLQVAASPVVNAVLSVGALEESVTVEAAAPLVDVQSSGISDVVQNEEILSLPLNGRNAVELVMVAGAAVPVTNAASRAVPGGMGISVAGGQSFGVAYLLDGATHNNPQDNLSLPFPSRRPAGVQRRDQRPQRPARHALRRGGQRGDQVGHQPHHRQRVRVRARPPLQRDEPVRADRTRRHTNR